MNAIARLDADGNVLSFDWSVYPVLGDVARKVHMEGSDAKIARIVVPPDLAGKTIPVLLTVTDSGRPPLCRYGRVLIEVIQRE